MLCIAINNIAIQNYIFEEKCKNYFKQKQNDSKDYYFKSEYESNLSQIGKDYILESGKSSENLTSEDFCNKEIKTVEYNDEHRKIKASTSEFLFFW